MLEGRQDFRLVLMIFYCQIKDIRMVAKSGRSRRSQICILTVINETYNLEITFRVLQSNLYNFDDIISVRIVSCKLLMFR